MKNSKNYIYKILKFIFGHLFLFIFRPTIINKEVIQASGSVIIAGNHKAAFDPGMVVMATKRVVHYIAKIELYKWWSSWFLYGMGTIPVDRKNRSGKTFEKAQSFLEKGEIVALFPEGTRNRTDEQLLPFKHGAVKLAQETNSKIIPFAITGRYIPFKKNIKVEFGEPIDVTGMETKEANDHLKNTVKGLLEKK